MEAKSVPLSAKMFDADHPFGNRYIFELKEVIDKCPEYLVPWTTFERLANEVGLELVSKANFHDFFYQHRAKKQYYDLLQKMRVVDASGGLTADEWDVCGVYMAFTFKKRSTPTDAISSSSGIYGKSSRPSSMQMAAKISPDSIVRVRHTTPTPTAVAPTDTPATATIAAPPEDTPHQ
jgi:hypothetical protein